MTEIDTIDTLYSERAQCVVALARAAKALGYVVGFGTDADAELVAWPVLYIDLPTGQVSWHLTLADRCAAPDIGAYPGHWDGHTTKDKYKRLGMWLPNVTVSDELTVTIKAAITSLAAQLATPSVASIRESRTAMREQMALVIDTTCYTYDAALELEDAVSALFDRLEAVEDALRAIVVAVTEPEVR